jgi:ABC-type iron transport system FetAB permease component
MGILLMFLMVCLIIYAVLVTHGIYFLSNMVIIKWLGLEMSQKLLWSVVNTILWLFSIRFIYFLLLDSKGGTPNMEAVWKFYMVIATVLFLIVFLLGYKSK